MKTPILMAVIGAAHGVRGAVKVKSFAADPLGLGAYGPLAAADGRVFEVVDARPIGQAVVVTFRGLADRTAAEGLSGTELFVDRSALPDGDDEDAYYHADLISLAVHNEEGDVIGRVRAVHDFGAGDILELERVDAPSVYIPFTRAAVPLVDVAAGFLRVDSRAAGLLDSDDGSSSENRVASPAGGRQRRAKGGPAAGRDGDRR